MKMDESGYNGWKGMQMEENICDATIIADAVIVLGKYEFMKC